MTNPKCTSCKKIISGEVAYFATKPYHGECLKTKKRKEHNAKVRKHLDEFRKRMEEAWVLKRREKVKQWNQTRKEVKINGNDP